MSAIKVCRVCLANDREMYRLANTALEETYERVTTKMLVLEGRPCCVCGVCLAALRRCRRLIDTAREANDALDRWLRNQELKLVEQPLYSLVRAPTELVDISGVGSLESGIKLERNSAEKECEISNLKNNSAYNDEGNILTKKIKDEVTESGNNDTQLVGSMNYESDNTHDSDDDSIKTQMSDSIEGHSSQALPHFECVDVPEEMTDVENHTKMLDNGRPDISEVYDVGDKTPGTSSPGKKHPTLQVVVFQRPRKRDIQNSEIRTPSELMDISGVESLESGVKLEKNSAEKKCEISNLENNSAYNDEGNILTKKIKDEVIESGNNDTQLVGSMNYESDNTHDSDDDSIKTQMSDSIEGHSSQALPHFECVDVPEKMTDVENHTQMLDNGRPDISEVYDVGDNTPGMSSPGKKHPTSQVVVFQRPRKRDIQNSERGPALKRGRPTTSVHLSGTGYTDPAVALKDNKVVLIYSCPRCNYKTTQVSLLKIHLVNHRVENRFACNKCIFKSTRKCSLVQHLKTHTGEKLFACDQCDFKCKYKINLSLHLRTHNGEKLFLSNTEEIKLCDAKSDLKKPIKYGECDFKSTQKPILKQHLQVHPGSKPFKCDKCDFKSNYKSCLSEHLNTHSGVKAFACDQCDFKSYYKSSLSKHQMAHTGEKRFYCDKCEYKCNANRDLKKHSSIHTSEKPFACDKCDYKCGHGSQLKRHMLTHTATGKKAFSCNYCDYKCIRKDYLVNHLFKHTRDKPFLCDKCDYKCTLKSQLKKHLLNHSEQKPFSCDFCEYRCNRKYNLNDHMRIHTGEKPFACDKCSFRCNKQQGLKRHLRTHTGEKPFSCDKCDYKSTNKQGLDKHKSVHGFQSSV